MVTLGVFDRLPCRFSRKSNPVTLAITAVALEGAFPAALAVFATRVVLATLASPRTRLPRPHRTCFPCGW